MNRAEVAAADMDRRLRAAERQLRQIPSRFGRGGGVPDALVLVILNGNDVGGGLLGVLYAGAVSLSSLPSLTADSTVANGLGRALLYINGAPQGRVWVRHDRGADVAPLPAGARRQAVGAPVSISYGSGAISAYRWDY